MSTTRKTISKMTDEELSLAEATFTAYHVEAAKYARGDTTVPRFEDTPLSTKRIFLAAAMAARGHRLPNPGYGAKE